ncbi:hypothetical protein MATL_G00217180 [Megalops atlanticus]|uniref:Uncharacterized protein n=1 Tax=Megalops atlanticus TaxID=7932 RepID=A0A9D3PGU6_MEGAT|nr:hypothetical protein MATL_G00217180 [Megalops atlanticus]
MATKTCLPGFKYDSLVNACLRQQNPTESPIVLQPSATVPPQGAPEVSLSVWITVAVVVNGSILALFLWFIIYKRQTTRSHTAVDTEAECSSGVQPAGRANPAAVAVETEEPPISCPHLNGGPPSSAKQEAPTWQESLECDTGNEGGAYVCNGRKDHKIPLPATELGDAALVTTKTVQCTE